MGGKPLGQYVMDLAESDPGALNSSLVLKSDRKPQTDPVTGKKNFDAPPLWMPTEIFGSDIVADGDATHGGLLKRTHNHEEAGRSNNPPNADAPAQGVAEQVVAGRAGQGSR